MKRVHLYEVGDDITIRADAAYNAGVTGKVTTVRGRAEAPSSYDVTLPCGGLVNLSAKNYSGDEPATAVIPLPSGRTLPITTIWGEPRPVYYVLREGGAAPRHRHGSRIKASNEARRLAVKHPGAVFHVVKLKATYTVKEDETETRFRIGDIAILIENCQAVEVIGHTDKYPATGEGLVRVKALKYGAGLSFRDEDVGYFLPDQLRMHPSGSRALALGLADD